MRRRAARSLLGAALVASVGCLAAPSAWAWPFGGSSKSAPKAPFDASAVAVGDRTGVETAQKIFAEGGNAVDAAVAMAFTLAVTDPDAGNLGGGGFMTLYVDGKPYFLDYRERAPQNATRDMYLDDKAALIPGLSTVGHRAVAVPGTVDGLWQAQRRFGKLKWQQVLEPAIGYATNGFQVPGWLARRHDDALKDFTGKTNFNAYFGGLKAGATFRQPELAQTLSRLSDSGGREFYEGRTADLIAQQMYGHGLITKPDLQQYKAVWRDPLVADWNGHRVITAPPPSTGGVALVQMLKMKAALKPAFDGVTLNSAPYIDLVAQIEDRVFADRQQYMADPDSYKVPTAHLTDDAYIAERVAEIKPDAKAGETPAKPGLGEGSLEKPQTTHFSVVDKWGNAVSNTYTLNGAFGSGVVVDGAGFVLNDAMDDFVTKAASARQPGPTASGEELNTIAAGRRPLSSMTPTIVLDGDKVSTVLGTPGGSRIPTTIFQVLADQYDFGMSPGDALAAMRFHHQLIPQKTIYGEPYRPITGELATQLQGLGYTVEQQTFNGDVQMVHVDGTSPQGFSDPRGVGMARSFVDAPKK